ncbi:hypothetical protein BDP27DRAFT_1364175 [Rhodocollybia butyracea]|uniref:Uncharacterized protein n=1 Tax=Rhodocollybia butyracea TaxID=206335 RepID=A0A9P5U7U7_9AGAR|nr:hypothetical protein BDP27DRAFT_1364175 [Rhodocollybia butyracea]
MHSSIYSEEDSRHHSGHGHAQRDDRERNTRWDEGSFHPDSSSDVPVSSPHADDCSDTVRPVEQNFHAIGPRAGHPSHTDERSYEDGQSPMAYEMTVSQSGRSAEVSLPGPVKQDLHAVELSPIAHHTNERSHGNRPQFSSADAAELAPQSARPARNTTAEPPSQQMRSLEAELLTARRENRTKNDENERLKRRLSSAQKEIAYYRKKDAHSQELLETQRRELQGALAFLNTIDAYSGGDIIDMLNALNSEIFQGAAIITDSLDGARPGGGSYRRSDEASEVEEIRRALGDEVRVLLQEDGTEGENIAINQAALQTSLNIALEQICRRWSNNDSADQALNDVYVQIRAQQGQVLVPGTWRSLTRAQTKPLVYQNPGLLEHIVGQMKAILVVAEWWPYRDSESERQIASMARKKVSAILELLAKLDEAMNERVTSTDMMLYVPALGVPFDAQTMEDADGGESSSGTVLLVPEMGLKRVAKNSAGRDETTVLLKPKVYLRESLVKQKTTRAVRGTEVQIRK